MFAFANLNDIGPCIGSIANIETASQVEQIMMYDYVLSENNGDDTTRLIRFLSHCGIKRLVLEAIVQKNYPGKDLDNLLQMLVPESPKAIELNERLKAEITQTQREKLQSCKFAN